MWHLLSLMILANLAYADADSVQTESDEIIFSIEKNLEQEHLAKLLNLNTRNTLNSPVIFYSIQNINADSDRQVFLEVQVTSEHYGELYKSVQNKNTPLTIAAGDSVRFSDLDIINGNVPGIEGEPKFDFVLSSNGRTVLSRINQGAALDDHTYTIEASLLAKTDDADETTKIAADSTIFETSLQKEKLTISVDEEANDKLSNINFSRDTPVFSWDGRDDLTYRLVVVRKHKDVDHVEVLNNRFNTPFAENNIHDPENYVYLDVNYQGNNFSLPDEYRDLIDPGHYYVWQVRGNYPTITSEIEISTDTASFITGKSIEGELMELLTIFLGRETVEQKVRDGVQFHTLNINGIEHTAHEAVEYLRNLKSKIDKRQATIGG